MKASLDFYIGTLGMKKIKEMGDGVLLQALGDLTIYLEAGRTTAAADPISGPVSCMCFSLEEGIQASYETLKKAGVPMVGHYFDFGPEFHMFRVADPSGNVIEFAGKP